MVVFSVEGDHIRMGLGEFFQLGVDSSHVGIISSFSGGVVSVASGSIPVALDRLGVNTDFNAEGFRDTVEEVSSHPEVVAAFNSFAGSDLELPLSGHNLAVGTVDLNTGIEAGFVMSFHDISALVESGADGAVVRSLGLGVVTQGPAEGPGQSCSDGGQNRVLLLNSEPRVVLAQIREDFGREMSEIGHCGLAINMVGLAKHDFIGGASEGVVE